MVDQASPEVESGPVVALGGSAGALEALQAFFDALPPESQATFCVITHHPADQPSMLPDLLRYRTALVVEEARDGRSLLPGHIYVMIAESHHEWVLSGGVLRLRERRESGTGSSRRADVHYPVDLFFRSLARELGPRAIGVILSGSGTDGSVGLREIKSHGGAVIVQDPATARFDGMPTSALATGLVDEVLAPGDIPDALARCMAACPDRDDTEAEALDEALLHAILQLIVQRTGHDLSGYKRSTILRRLERRMGLHAIEQAEHYIQMLRETPAEIDLLFKEILISVTRFFRDPDAWWALEEQIRSARSRQDSRDRETLRAWVIGCATGEEAYSLAISLRETLGVETAPPLQVFATDVDAEALHIARAGWYPAGIAEDVPEQRLARYFVAEEGGFRVRKEIRDLIVFAEHNALQDPPFIRIDLVTCRNLLIYLDRRRQSDLYALLRYSLGRDGLLMLGPSESPSEGFETLDHQARIYQSLERAPIMRLPSRSPTGGDLATQPGGNPPAEPRSRGAELSRAVERVLAGSFAPPCVLVNGNGEVVYVHGHTGRYLELAPGPTQTQLLDMAREGLRGQLLRILGEAAQKPSEEISAIGRLRVDNGHELVEMRARYLRSPPAVQGLYLVSFHSPGPESAQREAPAEGTSTTSDAGEAEPSAAASSEGDSAAARLRRELEMVQQDKEVTVQELQSMNEELQSMNEELKSSNEELEAAKEEVDSLNEELRSVNSELEAKVAALSEASDDMKNLLESTDIATLFLGEDMRIKRFTAAARQLVSLRSSDLGRPINELATNLDYEDLTADAEEVLDTLTPKDVEVRTKEGHWYILRIMPYRTTQNVINGLVCTFRDHHRAKWMEAREKLFRSVVETFGEPLVVIDRSFQVVLANHSFSALHGEQTAALEGRSLLELGEGAWDDPGLREGLIRTFESGQSIEGIEVQAPPGHGTAGRYLAKTRRLYQDRENEIMVLVALEPAPTGS